MHSNDDRAKFYADLLIQKSEKLKNETYLMKGKLNNAWISFKTNREHAKKTVEALLDKAQHQALKIALDNNYHRTKELVRIYSISANLFYEVGDYDEALKQAELAYETSKHVNDISSKAKGAIRLAHYYTELVPEKYLSLIHI